VPGGGLGPELGQRQSNGAERLSREELARRLEEHGLPPLVFGYDKPVIELGGHKSNNGP
jgi:hypothetical protein